MADIKGIVIPDGDIFTRVEREHKQFAALSVLFAHLVAKGKRINEKYAEGYFNINTLDDLAVCLYRNQDISFEDMIELVGQLSDGNLAELYEKVA